ncbi:MAG: HAMP domain-containing sensor histidine kinase [bacterium]|nr:HAMP domain-containing sensor histidine kinase [bacterium]
MNKKVSETSKNIPKAMLPRMLRTFLFTVSIFTLVLLILLVIAERIYHSYIFYGDEPVYQVVKIAQKNMIGIFVSAWLIGIIVDMYIYWKKTLNYLDTLAEATTKLLSNDDELIHLPEELKAIEDELNNTKKAVLRNEQLAKQSEQRKNDLIMYLAHDLKTPLTSVIGYLTLLRDEEQISSELREHYLSVSLDRAERLEELINEFFEITRFNLTNITLERSRTNMTRMLEQISYEFGPLYAEKNLTCSLDLEPDIEMLIDVDKMERVFDNLIRNAINYSFENSTITISAHKKADYVEMTFTNEGNTIPEEKLKRIFEQFFRLDSSRTSKTGGAGLGLAISKEIVELHHGMISAYSKDEEIQFSIKIPTGL